MAGMPSTRAKLAAVEQELEQANAKLSKYQQDQRPKRVRALAKELNDQTREALVEDMLDRAEDGESITEIAAAWGHTADILQEWAKSDVQFARSLGLASTRARAAMERTVRNALKSGRNLSGTLVDRVQAMYATANVAGGADAAGLVVVHHRASD
jgi:hypothetical protein